MGNETKVILITFRDSPPPHYCGSADSIIDGKNVHPKSVVKAVYNSKYPT